jgi:hypothetical protein
LFFSDLRFNFGLTYFFIMKNHYDLSINYAERLVEIKLQRLSKELPKIIYAVWPKDEDLKKYFEDINLYFIIESKKNKDDSCTILHTVKYDFKYNKFKSRDIIFEFAVWKALLFFENE